MQAFGTSERAAVDAAHSAATVGLVSRADFLAARDRAEAQAEAEAEAKKAAGVAASEKARDAQRAARDAQRKRERAALSFAADDDSDEGWEESDEDDPVEDLIHRERIRERDLLRTPGCLALGRKAFRLEDMPRVTERDREILRRVLYILREAERFCAGVRSARVAPSTATIWAPRRARLRASTPSRGSRSSRSPTRDVFAGATAASSRSRGRGSGRSPSSATR